MEEEVLAPSVEGDAPWVRDAHLDGAFEHAALRGVAEEAAVDAADWAVGGFDVGVSTFDC